MIGIYSIKNNINGKIYIGQSHDIEKRFKTHIIKSPNLHLWSAYKKYGIENFTFSVVREISNSGLTQILLDIYEKKYIEQYNSMDNKYGYNKKISGGNGKYSQEVKDKMSATRKGVPHPKWTEERKAKLSESRHKLRGTLKMTEEHKRHISEANKGKHFHVVTDETRKKQSQAQKMLYEKKQGNKRDPLTGRYIAKIIKEIL